LFQFTYHITVRVHANTKALADSTMDSFLKMLKELGIEEGTKYRLRGFEQKAEGYSFSYLLIVALIEESSPDSEKKVSEILASLQFNQSVTSASYRQHGQATSVGYVSKR
jgi:UDP-N-acetylglucosamine pyrophosphorylase